MNEDSGEIRMTAEEHRAYVDYMNLARQMEDMERQHIYFRGHTDAVAYLKKSKRSDADGTEPPCRFLILLPIQALYLHIFQKSICR